MNQVNNNSLCYPSNADMDWSGRGGAMDWSGRGGGPSPMMWNPNPTQLPSPAVCPPQPPAPSAAMPTYNTLPMYNNLNANLANANFQPPVSSTGYIPDPNNPDGLWWRSGRFAPPMQFDPAMPMLPDLGPTRMPEARMMRSPRPYYWNGMNSYNGYAFR